MQLGRVVLLLLVFVRSEAIRTEARGWFEPGRQLFKISGTEYLNIRAGPANFTGGCSPKKVPSVRLNLPYDGRAIRGF